MSRTTPGSPAGQPRRFSLAFSGSFDADACVRLAGGAIILVTLCQILFLLIGCDWDFSGDEAEFWVWSRRLDWSYYGADR